MTIVAAAGASDRWVVLHAPAYPDLADLSMQANTAGRRSAVRERLSASLDAQAPQLLEPLRRELTAADPSATVDVRDRIWMDGTLVAHVRADPSLVQAATGHSLDDLLASDGALALDPTALPPLDAPTPATPAGVTTTNAVEHATAAREATTPQWFDHALGIDTAHAQGLDGTGTRIAIVDSGVDVDHPELAGAAARGSRFDPFAATTASKWGSGHATFVAGLALGSRTGVAPGSTLLAARTYATDFGDHAGESDAARRTFRVNATRALQWALAPAGDASAGADLLVTSWGVLDEPGQPDPAWDRAAHTIAASGAVLVAAAGNDGGDPASGRSTLATPAMLEDAIAVGGVDRSFHHHPEASVGPSPRTGLTKPDLAEPVVDVRSLAPDDGHVDTSGNPGGGFAGTSAAAPIAAGVLALLVQAVRARGGDAPDLDDIHSVLPTLTVDVDASGPDAGTGHGVLGAWNIATAADAIVARHR